MLKHLAHAVQHLALPLSLRCSCSVMADLDLDEILNETYQLEQGLLPEHILSQDAFATSLDSHHMCFGPFCDLIWFDSNCVSLIWHFLI